jgi:2-hydroxychromene-2-carboxylate isomerase
LRVFLSRVLSTFATSPARLEAMHALRGAARRLKLQPAVVRYFHQADDPYSVLAAHALAPLQQRYRLRVERHAVPPPIREAAPEPEMLAAYAQRDAALLAKAYGLPAPTPEAETASTETLAAGAALRAKLGHYQGAMFEYQREWFWGLDRLHYLEARLARAGLDRQRGAAPLFPALDYDLAKARPGARRPELHFFLSFRSPYTFIAAELIEDIAKAHGAELKLRFVLPMVMRGLPVPPAKRLYIMLDAKREASRRGLKFGTMVDPVGKGAERGLAVLHHAIAAGKGPAFMRSFLRGVFAEGLDAASEQGLITMAARAGVGAQEVRAALADPSWRPVAENNRQEMFAHGVWGVPSFRVNECPMIWGQDRLFALQAQIVDADEA